MTTSDVDGTIPALFGVDVSKFQGKPDWAQVKAAGVTFALAKVSEGRTYLDSSYAYNKAAIPAAGLVPGAYHYLYWSTAYTTDAAWGGQAEWFVRNADPNAIHALDVEMRAPAGQFLNVRAWVERYRQLMPGHDAEGNGWSTRPPRQARDLELGITTKRLPTMTTLAR